MTRDYVVPGVGRNIGQAKTGWRGYFTGNAVHMTNTDRAVVIGRWWTHRQQRLPANGRSSSVGFGGMTVQPPRYTSGR
ncbi:MAG TPA: hypothetical protein VLT58_03675 [Polyangia bacterium]|nr:hypothetical protein [Polyangia bacterium]